MPRLNINKIFGYGYNSYSDWEETPEEDWMNDEELNFYQLCGGYLDDINKLLPLDDLPFRESFKNLNRKGINWWGYGNTPKVDGVDCYTFTSRIIKNNIGKSFDGTYSYFCRKVKNIPNRDDIFMGYFQRRFIDFIIDDNGNIQEGHRRYQRRKHNPIVILSQDYSETWIARTVYSDKYAWTETFKYPLSIREKELRKIELEEKPVSTTGTKYVFESKNDRRYQKMHQEREQARRKKERLEKQARLEKQYSFLTKSEIALKESKNEDLVKLYTKGFDSESFRGTHYHGRKNKKQ